MRSLDRPNTTNNLTVGLIPARWHSTRFQGKPLAPINGVPIFEDGNITIDASDDAVGVIADKTAVAALTSVETRTERQRDASLRATEVVMTSDYGVFELDDTKGAPIYLKWVTLQLLKE